MFCALSDLRTESDVEQKLQWPLLTTSTPNGLGFSAPDLLTKPNTRALEIGKGTTRKTYLPDYLGLIAGLPILIVEAKSPRESLENALAEARMYANELNALFPRDV